MTSDTVNISRRAMVDIMNISGNRNLKTQFDFLHKEIETKTGCVDDRHNNQMISHFKSEYKSRWEASHRMKQRFLQNNDVWLEAILNFSCASKKRSGRPTMPFEDSSERMKRQKTKDLRKSVPLPQLAYATQMAMRASGQTEASKLVKEIVSDPAVCAKYTDADAYREALDITPLSIEDALALIVEAGLSRHQYELVRSKAPKIFPSYKNVQAAKKECYPEPETMIISETSAHVDLQAALNLTTKRLVVSQKDVIDTLSCDEKKNLYLYSKWGFDGSSGHSSYKQAFCGVEADDASVFITSFVPLRLVTGSKIVWQNPRPGSTRYCRPLKIEFVKESTSVSLGEKSRIDAQIQQLTLSEMQVGEDIIKVKHNMIFSMIDGKICNAITETTSTQKCYICGATSREFNDIDKILKRPIKSKNLEFGISVLHGWIRFFECLLHLAYKIPIQKWQARGSDKDIVAETKEHIQAQFKERLGLIVDKPKPGFGNTNDGNTARRFFQNSTISAEITKVDLKLIEQLHVILIVISSGHEIDVEKFRKYALDTANYFVLKYPWYYMPPTLHKFLLHGSEIIDSALLPIGLLTEEAQEARNKDFKKLREHHSRKSSRAASNEDVFNFLLLSSDPLITSKRNLPKKKLSLIPKEAVELLRPPSVQLVRFEGDQLYVSDEDY